MARIKTKSVYERIQEKQDEILKTEEMLKTLNYELQELFQEKDDLEMRLLLQKVKEKKLDITKALDLLNIAQ